jgi:predicted phage terminase large subunit-like protein
MTAMVEDDFVSSVRDAGIELSDMAGFANELRIMVGGSRREGLDQLLDWGTYYLPHYHTAPPSDLHRSLDEDLTDFHKKRGQRHLTIAPRGSAKSTWCTLEYPLKCVCETLERYIIIVSDTFDQAKEFLEAIKVELEENDKLARDYPYAVGRGKVWTKNRIITANGITIEAISRGMKIRGRRRKQNRPTLIIVDDMENDDDAFSPKQREKTKSWFNKALLKAGDKNTNVLVVGTIIHRDAVLPTLYNTPGWKKRMFRAIESWPRNMELWNEWEAIFSDLTNERAEEAAREYFKKNKKKMMAGAKVLWPERESLYDLMVMRIMEGHASFESEKQNNPRDPSLVEWPESYFGDHIWADRWPKDDELTIKTFCLDPSKGKDSKQGNESKRADYQAFVRIGRHLSGIIFVEADLVRVSKEEMIEQALDLLKRFGRCDAFGIETNQWQELLAADFDDAIRQRGMVLPLHEINNLVPKVVRIRRIGTFLSRHMLRFIRRSEGTRMLVEQLMDFPNASYDDGPDALEMCLRIAIQLSHEVAPQ